MSIVRSVGTILAIGYACLGANAGLGQDYPNKPIRILAGAAGGAGDFGARVVAQGLTASWGQQAIVDNRNHVLEDIVSKSSPDGYTLLVDGTSMWLTPLLQKMSYDPIKDFAPITILTTSPNIMVVHPSVPANSVKELIALAKAKPGALNYGSGGGSGSGSHLAAEMFKSMAGINIVHIPYKGAGPAVIGLLGNEIQLTIGSTPSVGPHVKSGKLKALAVTSAQPSALVPGLPTVASAGLAGYEYAGRIGMWAPAKTPVTLISRLHEETVRIITAPELKDKFSSIGVEPTPITPVEFAARIKSEMAKWGKVIKDAGIKAD